MRAAERGAQHAGRLEAVDLGHLHIHQDQVVAAALAFRDRLRAVDSDVDLEAGRAQELERHFLVHDVVFGEKDACAAAGLAQRVEIGDARPALLAGRGKGRASGHRLDQRIVERRCRHRLDQHPADAGRTRVTPERILVVGADKHARRRLPIRALAQASGGLDAVDAVHLPVDDVEVIGISRGGGSVGQRQRFLARRGDVDLHMLLAQHVRQGLARFREIVGEQAAEAGHFSASGGSRWLGRARQHRREPEAAADAGRAVDARLSAHQLRQLARDGEPEAGAAVAARGRAVGLLEGGEQRAHAVGGDADARVVHLEAHVERRRLPVDPGGSQGDGATLGELDGVAEQVEQRLRDPGRVAVDDGRQVVGGDDELEPLRSRLVGDQRAGPRQHRVDREIGRVQPKLAGLDLREIEDVVDDVEQVVGGVAHLRQTGERSRLVHLAAQQVPSGR